MLPHPTPIILLVVLLVGRHPARGESRREQDPERAEGVEQWAQAVTAEHEVAALQADHRPTAGDIGRRRMGAVVVQLLGGKMKTLF